MNVQTTHEEREELDKIIKERTGKYCDDAVDQLTDQQLMQFLEEARRRLRRKREMISFVSG
jgi:hypothetical protein